MQKKTIQNSYTIDRDDRVVAVDPVWDEFADANNGELALSRNVLNRPIWNFIAGETTQHIYEQMVAQVREGTTIRFNFRCDSPTLKRFFEMVMSPLPDDHVRFETFVRKVAEPHETDEERSGQRDTAIITCSWCKKVTTGDNVWYEIKDAVELLRIFETNPLLSHGICLSCYEVVILDITHEGSTK